MTLKSSNISPKLSEKESSKTLITMWTRLCEILLTNGARGRLLDQLLWRILTLLEQVMVVMQTTKTTNDICELMEMLA